MDIIVTIVVGFLAGALGGWFAEHKSHRYALMREEWAAGKTLRGLLNQCLEKHRYCGRMKKEDTAPVFHDFMTIDSGKGSMLNRIDDAVSEFKDFLIRKVDQDEFQDTWNQLRYSFANIPKKSDFTNTSVTYNLKKEEAYEHALERLTKLKSLSLRHWSKLWNS